MLFNPNLKLLTQKIEFLILLLLRLYLNQEELNLSMLL